MRIIEFFECHKMFSSLILSLMWISHKWLNSIQRKVNFMFICTWTVIILLDDIISSFCDLMGISKKEYEYIISTFGFFSTLWILLCIYNIINKSSVEKNVILQKNTHEN